MSTKQMIKYIAIGFGAGFITGIITKISLYLLIGAVVGCGIFWLGQKGIKEF